MLEEGKKDYFFSSSATITAKLAQISSVHKDILAWNSYLYLPSSLVSWFMNAKLSSYGPVKHKELFRARNDTEVLATTSHETEPSELPPSSITSG